MRVLQNTNAEPAGKIIESFIGSAFDAVKEVSDNLDMIAEIALAIENGTLGDYLTAQSIDTLAELNAILTDANLGSVETLATAAQGLKADSASQPGHTHPESDISDLQDYYTEDDLATQAEAETGTLNDKLMTPLRVQQAIRLQANVVKHNYIAITDPTVNDDSTEGYAVTSTWINTTTDESFKCVDPAEDAAVWVKTTLTADELATVAFTGDSDDLTEGTTKLLMTPPERTKLGELGVVPNFNNQAGTVYNIQPSDIGKMLMFTNAAEITVNLPDALPVGFYTWVNQLNSGTPKITPDTEMINGVSDVLAVPGQWQGIFLVKYAAGVWYGISGSIGGSVIYMPIGEIFGL